MKLIYFVSITICVSLSIDLCRSMQQGLSGFPQPKAIRGNAGFFRQEITYPGGNPSGNHIVSNHAQNNQHVHHDQHHQQLLQHQPQVQHQEQLQQHRENTEFIQKPILPPTLRVNSIPIPAVTQPPIAANIPTRAIVDPSVVRSVQNRQNFEEVTTTTTLQPVPTTTRTRTTTEPATSEELEEQAKSAYYQFGSSVHDTINDHEHVRQETREGLALKGMYSYSDGFFRRTVHYVADEGGYRVVKEEIQPINDGDGPKFNPKGHAEVVASYLDSSKYSITVDDFKLNKEQEDIVDKQKN